MTQKIDPAMGWKFYLEQYHCDIIWNDLEKLCVAITDLAVLKTVSTANSWLAPFKALS